MALGCGFMLLVSLGVCYEQYGRKVLNDLERVSPILVEMGWWEIFFFFCGLFLQYSLSWPYLRQD